MLSIGSWTSTGNLPSSTWSSSPCWISTRENPIFTNVVQHRDSCDDSNSCRKAYCKWTTCNTNVTLKVTLPTHVYRNALFMQMDTCNNTFNTAKFVHFTYNINTSLYLQYEPNLWFQSHLLFQRPNVSSTLCRLSCGQRWMPYRAVSLDFSQVSSNIVPTGRPGRPRRDQCMAGFRTKLLKYNCSKYTHHACYWAIELQCLRVFSDV